jgi:hypothetical protein
MNDFTGKKAPYKLPLEFPIAYRLQGDLKEKSNIFGDDRACQF